VHTPALRWLSRHKASLTLRMARFSSLNWTKTACSQQIQLISAGDLGCATMVTRTRSAWNAPQLLRNCHLQQVLVEYTAHPEACFHCPAAG